MKIIYSILFLGMAFMLNGQNSHNIIVNIQDISSNQGQMLVKLYNAEETYRKVIFKLERAEISDNKAQVTFEGLENGVYAFAVFHDKNGNGKMDFNFLGIPKEPVAASNNARGFFGPPDFEAAKFEVKNKDVLQRIKM